MVPKHSKPFNAEFLLAVEEDSKMNKPLNKMMMMMAILINILLLATAGCSAEKSTTESEKKDQKQVAKPSDQPSDKDYVAIVNGTQIPRSEVDRKIELIKKRYTEMGTPIPQDQLAGMREKLINSLVEQELLYQESQAQGISVDTAAVDSDFENFKKQFKNEEDYQKQMKDLNYTEDVLKSQIQKTKIIQQLIEKNVMSTISIPDAELKSYYDSHPDEFKRPERARARHILVKVDASATDADKAAARKKIEGIDAQLKKGGDFEKLAAENSDCPSSKNGGDLGFFSRGQMVKPFEEAAFALKPGGISPIVETQFGFHIIKLESKEDATTLTFDQVKEELQQKLKQTKVRDALKSYIESIKNKGKVEIVQLEEQKSPESEPKNNETTEKP
jgi:peptidyl-prolyl cis-trans isomerase C